MALALALRSALRRSTSISICVHLSYSCTTLSGSASLLRSLTFRIWTERLLLKAWKSILARNAGSSVLAAVLACWLVMLAALQTIFAGNCLQRRLPNVNTAARKGAGQAIRAELPHTSRSWWHGRVHWEPGPMNYTMHGPPKDGGKSISRERAAMSTAGKSHYGCNGGQAWNAADIAWPPACPPDAAGTTPASSAPPQAQPDEILFLLPFLCGRCRAVGSVALWASRISRGWAAFKTLYIGS